MAKVSNHKRNHTRNDKMMNHINKTVENKSDSIKENNRNGTVNKIKYMKIDLTSSHPQ